MKLEALIQNMTDQIKEAQLKLGYARETMRLYYPEKHACTKEEITAVFEKFGAYECRQMPDGMDFDYVIYFTDSSIDAYDYCIREEMGHTIYHRFARADFEALMTIQ